MLGEEKQREATKGKKEQWAWTQKSDSTNSQPIQYSPPQTWPGRVPWPAVGQKYIFACWGYKKTLKKTCFHTHTAWSLFRDMNVPTMEPTQTRTCSWSCGRGCMVKAPNHGGKARPGAQILWPAGPGLISSTPACWAGDLGKSVYLLPYVSA